MWRNSLIFSVLALPAIGGVGNAQQAEPQDLFQVPVIRSSWDDLTDGIRTKEDWHRRRGVLKQRFLDLIRDEQKPERPPLEMRIHETVVVDQAYTRKLISYSVEADERAFAYLGIPLKPPEATQTRLVSSRAQSADGSRTTTHDQITNERHGVDDEP